MTRHDGAVPPGGRRAAVRDREEAVVARLQQLAADLDDIPDPRFRAATRDRLVAMAAVRTARPEPRSGLRRVRSALTDGAAPVAWRTRLATGLTGAALTVAALGALAALSTDARPDDLLYGVKRGTEQAQLALAGDDRGRTLLELARTRLDELAALPDPAAADVAGLLDTMDAQTREGAALLAAQAVGGRDAASVDGLADWAGRQSAELSELQPGLPAGAAAASQSSLELLTDVAGRAAGLRTALACPGGPATAGTDELGPVPAECPADEPAPGGLPDGAPAEGTSGVLPGGDEPAPGSADAPASTSAGPPAPAPAPTAGAEPVPTVPAPPAVDEPPLPLPEPPAPASPAEPGSPLLDTPLPVCIRPLVC